LPASRRRSPFTSADAWATLAAASSAAGLRGQDAELLRLGENAIFRLFQEPVVVRIARSFDVLQDAAKEVAVARWLRDAGIAAVEPTATTQPMVIHHHPVTFWKLIADSGIKATVGDLARILRQLHNLPVPPDLPLPGLDIFGRVAERIAASPDLPTAERDFLEQRLAQLHRDYADLTFPLPRSAVHGDAHQQNLIRRPDGQVVLIDLERFAFGQPETDLAVTATEHLVGWHTDAEYADFCTTYGFDVTQWDGFPVIRQINELKMTTWLMQNVGESERVACEFQIRLRSLHDPDAPRHWQPF
jgi:Ser/Thr protein kinase RdoA (MazF antagonist)